MYYHLNLLGNHIGSLEYPNLGNPICKKASIVYFDSNKNYRIELKKFETNPYVICKIKNRTRHPDNRITFESVDRFFDKFMMLKSLDEFILFCKDASNNIKEYLEGIRYFIVNDCINEQNKTKLDINNANVSFVYNSSNGQVSYDNSELLFWANKFAAPKTINRLCKITGENTNTTSEFSKPFGSNEKFFSANTDNQGYFIDSDKSFTVGEMCQNNISVACKTLKEKKMRICISENHFIYYWKEPKEKMDEFGDSFIENFDYGNTKEDLIINPERYLFVEITCNINPGRVRILSEGTFDTIGYSQRVNSVYELLGRNKILCKKVEQAFPNVRKYYITGNKSQLLELFSTLKKQVCLGVCKFSVNSFSFINFTERDKDVFQLLNLKENKNMDEFSYSYGKLLATVAKIEEQEYYGRNQTNMRNGSKFRKLSMWKNISRTLREIQKTMNRIRREHVNEYKVLMEKVLSFSPQTLTDDYVRGYLNQATNTEKEA